MPENLEQHLRDLNLPLPPSLLSPASLVAASRPRVIPFPQPELRRFRVGRGVRRAAVAAALVVAVNFAALQIWPSYRGVVAATPVIGPVTMGLLGNLGLAPSGPSPTTVFVSQVQQHTRVTVVAGYADAIRTIVVLKTDPVSYPFWEGPDRPTLTYQDGQSVTGLLGPALGGDQVLLFPPLGPNGSSRRLTLTLTIPALSAPYAKGAPRVHVAGYPSGPKGTFPAPVTFGHWRLTFQLPQRGGITLPLPKAQTVDGTTYTFTSLVKSGRFLDIAWNVSGYAPAQANAHPNSYPLMAAALGDYALYSPAGQAANIITEGGALPANTNVASAEAIFELSGSGTYRLEIDGQPAVVFTIVVP